MLVDPNQQEEPEVEELELPEEPVASGGSKGMVVTIILGVLFVVAAAGAGYLFTELGKTKKTLTSTQASLSSTKREVESLEEEKSALIEEKDALSQERDGLKNQLSQTQQELQTAQAQNASLSQTLKAKEAEEAKLNQQIAKLDSDLKKMQDKFEEISGRPAAGPDAGTEQALAQAEGTIEKLDRLLKEAQEQAAMAKKMQTEFERMLGKIDAPDLIHGTVAAVEALERLIVIDTGDHKVDVNERFVISNEEHEWMATVLVERVEGSLNIARIVRPMGEVAVMVGDTAIQVPANVTTLASAEGEGTP